MHQKEFSFYFKDDWKMRSNITLNLGLRFDYMGVPYERHGLVSAPIGGMKGLFGISGTSEADLYQPGHLAGSLMLVEPVGKNSENPDRQLFKNDWNNFAPAVGFSWS